MNIGAVYFAITPHISIQRFGYEPPPVIQMRLYDIVSFV